MGCEKKHMVLNGHMDFGANGKKRARTLFFLFNKQLILY